MPSRNGTRPSANGRAPAKRPARADDFYLQRTVTDPQLSPDGTRVAYTVSWSDRDSDETRMAVWVAPVDGGRPRRFTHGKRDHSPRWSPDGRYLAFISSRGDKNQLFVVPLDGGEARQVTHATFGVSQPAWSPDSARIAYVARTGDYKEPKERKGAERNAPRVIKHQYYRFDGIGYLDERRIHIFTVDVETEADTQITDGDWYDEQPSWSPDGKWIAFVSNRERVRHDAHQRPDVWMVRSTGGRARKLTRSLGSASFPAFSPDGRSIAFLGHEHGDAGGAKNIHLFVIPTAGGAPRSVSAPLDRPPIGHMMAAGRTFCWSRDGKSLLFLAADRGAQAIYRAGVTNGSVSRLVGGDRQIESFFPTPEGKRVVFTASWTDEPHEVYVASTDGNGRVRAISDANAELRKSVQLSPLRRVTHRAADGLEIESFVLYPPNHRPGRRYPLSLQIHGGPHGFHPTGFQLSYQAQAAAGYVVLLPNPRGSQTYGESFASMCVGDWGGRDYEDLMGAVDLMVRRGVADPDRLYVGGYSYGGFMTSWVVGHTDRFRAAVVGAPVTDHLSMFGTTDITSFAVYEHEGTPWNNGDAYRDRSPVTYLPNVSTPVLLVHWEGDLRCPIAQSEEVFQGLKVLGKPVEFVRYPGGFHGVRTPSQAVDYWQRVVDWHERHAPRARRKAGRVTRRARAKTGAR